MKIVAIGAKIMMLEKEQIPLKLHALFMVALCNRADHYIFILFLLLPFSSFFLFFLA